MNKNLLIVNMVLAGICIISGAVVGNWGSVMGWGVALMWEFMYFKTLED